MQSTHWLGPDQLGGQVEIFDESRVGQMAKKLLIKVK
jgi:hypothetical protein